MSVRSTEVFATTVNVSESDNVTAASKVEPRKEIVSFHTCYLNNFNSTRFLSNICIWLFMYLIRLELDMLVFLLNVKERDSGWENNELKTEILFF